MVLTVVVLSKLYVYYNLWQHKQLAAKRHRTPCAPPCFPVQRSTAGSLAGILMVSNTCRWNFTPSPGWTKEEANILKLCLMKYGVGRWVQILETGLLPGKMIQQLNGQTQRLLGQQSLAGARLARLCLGSSSQIREKYALMLWVEAAMRQPVFVCAAACRHIQQEERLLVPCQNTLCLGEECHVISLCLYLSHPFSFPFTAISALPLVTLFRPHKKRSQPYDMTWVASSDRGANLATGDGGSVHQPASGHRPHPRRQPAEAGCAAQVGPHHMGRPCVPEMCAATTREFAVCCSPTQTYDVPCQHWSSVYMPAHHLL